MKNKILHITIIASLTMNFVICWLMPEIEIGYVKDGFIWNHFNYMFFHANIFHLAGSGFALWFMLSNKRYSYFAILIASYIIAVAASFFCYSDLPTIGFSAPLYAMVGMQSSKFNIKDKFWIITIVFFIACIFIPNVNNLLHISCFALGFFYKIITDQWRKSLNDYKRFNKGK